MISINDRDELSRISREDNSQYNVSVDVLAKLLKTIDEWCVYEYGDTATFYFDNQSISIAYTTNEYIDGDKCTIFDANVCVNVATMSVEYYINDKLFSVDVCESVDELCNYINSCAFEDLTNVCCLDDKPSDVVEYYLCD